MRPGDIIRFRREMVEYDGQDDPELTDSLGLILQEVERFDDKSTRLFEVMINGRLVGAFDYEIEVVNEEG